jgi:hypothetical protein
VVSFTPRPHFAPGKGPPVPIVQEAGWTPEPVWPQSLEDKSFPPAGDLTPIARSSSPLSDTIMTELPRSYKTVENFIIQQYAASARVSQMRFVVDKVTMEQVALRVLPISVILPGLHT